MRKIHVDWLCSERLSKIRIGAGEIPATGAQAGQSAAHSWGPQQPGGAWPAPRAPGGRALCTQPTSDVTDHGGSGGSHTTFFLNGLQPSLILGISRNAGALQ